MGACTSARCAGAAGESPPLAGVAKPTVAPSIAPFTSSLPLTAAPTKHATH